MSVLFVAGAIMFFSCSSESSDSDSPTSDIEENNDPKTGTVSISVTIDDKRYSVTFTDSSEEGYTSKENVTQKVKSGKKAAVPGWTRDGYVLSWSSSVDGLLPSSAITSDVIFNAVWTKLVAYTVTFKDDSGENKDDLQTVESGNKASAPSWSRENYTLAWSSSVDGLSVDSAITSDVTFIAIWTEKPKCSNCGTHYDTEELAAACAVKEGCPNYGKVEVVALVDSEGKVISGNAKVSVTGSVNKKEDNGAVEIEYNGVKYKTVKFDSKASAVITANKGQQITVVGSLPNGKQKCFTVTDSNGKEETYKLDLKTTAITTYEKSFTSTGTDTIKKADTCSIALIIIE